MRPYTPAVQPGVYPTDMRQDVVVDARVTVMTVTERLKMAKTAQQPKRPKHKPLRTCIACRQTKPKRERLRIVRTPDGHVLIDATGKKSGRGAYLCAKLSCWEKAVKGKRLEHEFEIDNKSGDQFCQIMNDKICKNKW